jgi:hypothetical protein
LRRTSGSGDPQRRLQAGAKSMKSGVYVKHGHLATAKKAPIDWRRVDLDGALRRYQADRVLHGRGSHVP